MIKINENVWYYPNKCFLVKTTTDDYLCKAQEYIDNHFNRSIISSEPPEWVMDYFNNGCDYNLSYPISGGICSSLACQFACNYCSFSSGKNGDILCLDDAKIFINFLVKNAVAKKMLCPDADSKVTIQFTGGGEPTYDWDQFQSIVQYVKEICLGNNVQCELNITTNGFLSEEQVNYLIDNFTSIVVSFDGLPEIQRINRKIPQCEDLFQVVNRTLQQLNLKKALSGIISTVWPRDYSRISDMAEYIFDKYYNVLAWQINFIIPRGRAINVSPESKKACDYFVQEFINLKRHWGEKLPEKAIGCTLFKNGPCSFECGAFYGQHPWLLPDGKVISCLEANEQSAKLGEIRHGVFKKYIVHDNLADYSIKDRTRNCPNCIAYNFCGGGCPIQLENTARKKNMCYMEQIYWTKILTILSNNTPIFNIIPTEIKQHDIPNTNIYMLEFGEAK